MTNLGAIDVLRPSATTTATGGVLIDTVDLGAIPAMRRSRHLLCRLLGNDGTSRIGSSASGGTSSEQDDKDIETEEVKDHGPMTFPPVASVVPRLQHRVPHKPANVIEVDHVDLDPGFGGHGPPGARHRRQLHHGRLVHLRIGSTVASGNDSTQMVIPSRPDWRLAHAERPAPDPNVSSVVERGRASRAPPT